MTLGYSCDAGECDTLQDAAFTTITLNLDSLPTKQSLIMALNLREQGLIELDDALYMSAMQTLENGSEFNMNLPRVELHLCPDHALTALSAIDVIELDEEDSDVDQQT